MPVTLTPSLGPPFSGATIEENSAAYYVMASWVFPDLKLAKDGDVYSMRLDDAQGHMVGHMVRSVRRRATYTTESLGSPGCAGQTCVKVDMTELPPEDGGAPRTDGGDSGNPDGSQDSSIPDGASKPDSSHD